MKRSGGPSQAKTVPLMPSSADWTMGEATVLYTMRLSVRGSNTWS